jgi:hypothetical protein
MNAPTSDIVNLLSPISSPSKKVFGKLSPADPANSASNASNRADSSLAMSFKLDEPLKRSQRRSFEDNVLVTGRIPKRVKINSFSSGPSNVSTKLSYGIKSALSFELLLQ